MILPGLRAAGRCAALLVLVATPAFAQALPAPTPKPKWGPFIDLWGAAGTERNIGETDLFVPLLQDSTSMLFTDIRGRFDDRNSQEGNFGLGVRHMLASGWNLGAYGYYDRLKSALGNDFGQATFGAEALSLNWDARANFYQPIGPRIANLGNTSSTTAALSGTSVEVTTTGTHSQEVAMQGFDGEIGWRVPVFAADDTTQLRVYAGGYDFHASGVRSIAGPRGRIDLTIDQVPYLWHRARLELGGEIEHDGPRGTQAFAMLRLRIPLEVFASAPPASLTPMERRMEDPIVRDVDVVSETRTQATPTITETATETSGGSPITVLSSASTTGAALPGAVTTAGANSTVILSGTFNTTAATTLQSGQTVMGAGSVTVKTPSGRTATLTTSAATVTSSNNNAIVMGNNSTLTGMTINDTDTGSTAHGVFVSDVSDATVSNNTINATGSAGFSGTGVIIHTSSAVTISGNTINATGGSSTATAIYMYSGSSGTISGNTLNATAGGGNTGIGLYLANGGAGSVTVSSNSFNATGGATNYTVDLDAADILSGSSGNKAVAGSCNVAAAGTGTTITFTNASACGP
jgi:hypothetical protein